MDITNTLKKRIAARADVPMGSWLMTGATATAEAMGRCGFDFLVVDMEHVPLDLGLTVEIMRAVEATGSSPLVRVPWNDRVTIKRVLDAGARSILIPFVETVEEARAAVAAAKYAPAGHRGVAAVHRASGYGAAGDYLARANDETCVIVQLETPEAISRMAEIAGVPGIDGVFVGPGDLAASMGLIGQIGHDDVQAALADAAAQAARLDLPIGIVGPSPDMVRRFMDYGYSFVAIASDMVLMMTRARAVLSELRDDAPVEAPAGAAY